MRMMSTTRTPASSSLSPLILSCSLLSPPSVCPSAFDLCPLSLVLGPWTTNKRYASMPAACPTPPHPLRRTAPQPNPTHPAPIVLYVSFVDQAIYYFRRQEYEPAGEIFNRVLRDARSIGEGKTEARALGNLATVSTDSLVGVPSLGLGLVMCCAVL